MIKKPVATAITAILLIGCIAFGGKTFAQATPKLFINPPSVVDETLTPGKSLVVTIEVANITNLLAYEFKVYYKNNVLNLTSAIRPPGNFLEPSDPANQFVAKSEIKNNFNATYGRAWYGYTLLFPETSRSGSGILMQFTFYIIGVDSTPIVITDSILADDVGTEIPHDVNDGFFSNLGAPPPVSPAFVYIDPASIVDPTLTPSHNFTVNVKITNATNLLSFEFRLNYSAAIIEALELQEGTFLSNVGATSILKSQMDNVIGSLLFSVGLNAPPVATGNGTLATMKFRVLANGTSTLTLNAIVLKSPDNETLTFTKADGSFSNLLFKPGDINKDGKVNLIDLVEVAIRYGSTPADPKWNPDADVNHDNVINIFDLDFIVLHFGT